MGKSLLNLHSDAPTLDFEKLELADFVAGYIAMIKPYEATRKEVMLLNLLMLKASSYIHGRAHEVLTHTLQKRSSCVAWNSTMPYRFGTQLRFSLNTLT